MRCQDNVIKNNHIGNDDGDSDDNNDDDDNDYDGNNNSNDDDDNDNDTANDAGQMQSQQKVIFSALFLLFYVFSKNPVFQIPSKNIQTSNRLFHKKTPIIS